MRILLWAPFGAGTHYWGPGTSAFRLYQNLSNNNVKITLVHGSNLQGKFPDVYHQQIQIGCLDNKSKISLIVYLIKSYLWIKKNHHDYDVFHGISAFFYTFIPAIIFNQHNKKTYLKITGSRGGFENNSFISRVSGFSRFRLKQANKLKGYISVSSHITENLLANGIDHDKIFYIPNGVDVNRFSPVDESAKKSLRKAYNIDDVFTLCYIGGLTKNKRVIQTVHAVAQLLKNHYKVQFLIVGPDRSDGHVEKEIQDYADKMFLEERCIRVKQTNEPELYYKMSDVFVLNSEFEGLSNSLLEAMATGLPCIATPVSGTVDVIKDKITGFISDGSPARIASIVEDLYNDKQLYNLISLNARKEVENTFSMSNISAQHIKLFQK